MKKLIIAMCMMIFSVFAVQAAPIGNGAGGMADGLEDRLSFHEQGHGTVIAIAAVQNANFERIYGIGAPTAALTGKPTYSKIVISSVADIVRGVLGGGSIGISKTASAIW